MVATEAKVEDTSTQMHDWFEENNESKEEPPAEEVEVPHSSICFPHVPWMRWGLGEPILSTSCAVQEKSDAKKLQTAEAIRQLRNKKEILRIYCSVAATGCKLPWMAMGLGSQQTGWHYASKAPPRAFTQPVLSNGLSMALVPCKARSTQISIAVTPSTWAAWSLWLERSVCWDVSRSSKMTIWTNRTHRHVTFFRGKFHFGTWIGTVCRASRYWILSPETQGLCSVILVLTRGLRRVQDGPLRYVDMFGYNVGKHWNSVLKRIAWISALFKAAKRCAAKADQWSSWWGFCLVFLQMLPVTRDLLFPAAQQQERISPTKVSARLLGKNWEKTRSNY